VWLFLLAFILLQRNGLQFVVGKGKAGRGVLAATDGSLVPLAAILSIDPAGIDRLLDIL
jgi:hypothetical protein